MASVNSSGLARHVDAGQAEREWRADQRGAHRREGRREQAVGDAVDVIPARENLGIVREREGPGPVHPETRIQNQAERIKQEQHEKGERANNDGVAEPFHVPRVHGDLRRIVGKRQRGARVAAT